MVVVSTLPVVKLVQPFFDLHPHLSVRFRLLSQSLDVVVADS